MMRKSDLQFIHDTLFMKAILSEPSMNKTADDFFSGVASRIKGEVSDLKSPEAVLAFLIPGAFWTLGFKKLTIIYAIAEGLGFNPTHFFSSLREGIKPILESLFAGGTTNKSEIETIVGNSAEQAMTNTVDPDKLQEAVQVNSNKRILDTTMIVLAYGNKYSADPFFYAKIKEFANSALGNKARSGITGMLTKIFSWILSTILYSLGFAVIGAAASQALGLNKKKEDESSDGSPDVQQVSTKNTSGKDVALHLNPSADSNLYTTTYNDMNHVWLLHFNINDVKQQLMDWAKELYPQLTDPAAFNASGSFGRTVKMFQDRNKNTGQLGITAVPTPYTSIKQIVDSFAADVASKMP
jgi:hypothetical protein